MADLDARKRQKLRTELRASAKKRGITLACVRPNCTTGDELEVHHKDFNSENNQKVNLEWLCRTHHYMTHNKVIWSKIKVGNLALPLKESQAEILDVLKEQELNEEWIPLLEAMAAKPAGALKTAVRMQLIKRGAVTTGGTEYAAQVYGEHIAVLYRGITIEVRSGETVRFLGSVR